MKNLIYTLILLLACLNLNAQYTIDFEPVGLLDGRIEGFLDQVQARISTPSSLSAPLETYILISIEDTNIPLDMSSQSFYEDYEITIDPGLNIFTVRNIVDSYTGVDIEGFDYTPIWIEDYIVDQRRLPPGDYTSCVTIYNAETRSQLASDCFNFELEKDDPPTILTPFDTPEGIWLPLSDPINIPMNWYHPYTTVGYTIEMKKIGDISDVIDFDKTDHEAFYALPLAITPVEDIPIKNYTINADDELDITAQNFYALRVTAQSDVDRFENQGRSNIVIVAYGVAASRLCEHPDIVTNMVWPVPGDTIPFRDPFYVGYFEPLCSQTRDASIAFGTYTADGETVRSTIGDNIWRINGGGAYHFLEHISTVSGLPLDFVLPDSTYAQHLPFVHNENGSPLPDLHPNEEGYKFSGNLTFTSYDEALGQEVSSSKPITDYFENPYHIGMSRPNLISPEHDAQMIPGDITFNFDTGNRPSSPLPPFQIMKIEGNNISNPYLNVYEKMVLQVSKDEEFSQDNIVYDGLRTIQACSAHPDNLHDWESPTFSSLPEDIPIEQTTDRLYRSEDFLSQIYRAGDMTFNFADEDTLYWRVVWLQNPREINVSEPHTENINLMSNDIYHESTVRRLIITNSAVANASSDEDGEAEDDECISNCELPTITNRTAIDNISIGETFEIGLFTVTITELTSSRGNSASGRGTILLPFLNNAQLMVRFTGVGINTDRKVYQGDVVGVEDATPFRIQRQTGSEIPYVDSTDIARFNDWMNESERVFNFLNGNPIGLPIGLDREIAGRQVILGMVEATFSPTSSEASFVTAVEIPEIHSHIGLGATGICLQPNGLTTDNLVLYLPYDQGIDFQGTSFKLKGGDPSNPENLCFATFTCNGMRNMQVAAECKFPRSALIPDEGGNPSTNESERVTFFSKARYDFGEGLIMKFDMDDFYVNGVEKFRFSLNDAYLDLSSSLNPPDIEFPDNYNHEHFEDDRMGEAWEGFYMKELGMAFSDDLIDIGESTISVNNFIYDSDITFKVGAYNLIENGSIADWKATLDTIELVVTQSEIDNINVGGKLEPPLAAPGEYMNYALVLDFNDDGDYYIQVDVADSLRIPLMVAKMTLFEDSYVRAGYSGARGTAYVRANFSGSITISDDYDFEGTSGVPSMSIPSLQFQELVMDSQHGISCSNWDFAGIEDFSGRGFAPPPILREGDNQAFTSGFPLSIEELNLGGGMSDPTLSATIRLALAQGNNGIAADCRLNFVGSYEDTGHGNKIQLQDVNLDRISVQAEFSAVSLNGSLEWTKNETKEEIRGSIEVGIPMGIEVNIAAIFGTIKVDPLAPFNTTNHYNYWLVDGNVSFGDNGIPICSGIAMFGLGGGVWSKMQLDTNLPDPKSTLQAPNNNSNNLTRVDLSRYSPDFNTILGLRFSTVLGIQNASSTINLHVGITAEFTRSHGLARLDVNGAVYVMQSKESGSEGLLYGTASLSYRNNDSGKTFTGEIDVWLDIGGFIVGAIEEDDTKMADVDFYAGEQDGEDMWYFHMGSYDPSSGVITPGAAIALMLGDTPIARVSSYMMVGHGVSEQLPLPPARVCEVLGINNQSNGGNSFSSNSVTTESTADYNSGTRIGAGNFNTAQGFAFGAALESNIEVGLFVYFALGFDIGFDVLVRKVSYECSGYGEPGINGWYASGQAYAGLYGELGIKFRFFGKRKIKLFALEVAMMLEAHIPRPNYFKGSAGVRFSVLGGVFTGHKTFKFEAGNKCERLYNDPLANIEFIDKIEPTSDTDPNSIFINPSVAFNFPMDRMLFLPRTMDDESGLVTSYYEFKPTITEFEVRKLEDITIIEGANRYAPDRKTAIKETTNAFEGFTEYETTCSVKVIDYTDEATHYYYQDSLGGDWIETRSETFSTGEYPTILEDEHVMYTYPLQNQRFHLQKQTNNQGVIRLYKGIPGLFYESNDGENFDYVLRVTRANDFEEKHDTPINYAGGQYIETSLPSLENEEIYIAQVIRKPRIIDQNDDNQTESSSMNNLGDIVTVGGRNYLREVVNKRLTDNITGYSELFVERLTPESLISQHEFKLFEFYFRTSKYDRLSQKLSNSITEVEARTPSAIGYYLDADVEVDIDEGFDVYDLNGYYNRGERVVDPLLSLRDPMISDYWNKHGIKNLYDNISMLPNLSEIRIINNLKYEIVGDWPNGRRKYPYYQDVEQRKLYTVASSNTTMSPIWQGMIDSAIEENNQPEESDNLPNTTNNLLPNNIGFGMNLGSSLGINPTIGGGLIQDHLLGESFFQSSPTKLLLNYTLARKSHNRWMQTRSKIYDFYFLREVPINYGPYIVRIPLDKQLRFYIYDNHRTESYNYEIVRITPYNKFIYVTQPYEDAAQEFNTGTISNRYQIRFEYHPPRLSSSLRAYIGNVIQKEFLMSEDLSRIQLSDGTVLH